MPAAIPLAIVGSAAVGAAATSSAARRTANAAENTAAANNDLQREVYNRNTANMAPYLSGGNWAWDTWQSAMGRPSAAQPQTQPLQPGAIAGNGSNAPGLGSGSGTQVTGQGRGNALAGLFGQQDLAVSAAAREAGGDGRLVRPDEPRGTTTLGNALTVGATGTATPNALTGYDAFKASTGYQTGLAEGMRGLNARLATGGRLFSGDAGREAIRYNQQYADNFMGDYLSRLMQGAQLGQGSASALAGVGQNYANSTSANNNTALNAQAQANAATGNALAGLAGAAGSAAGYYYGNQPTNALGSSYSGGNASSGSGRPIFWG